MTTSINEELTDDDDVVEESPEAEVQKAYDAAKAVPWSISRQSVAMALGCSILSGVFGPELKALQTKGVYPSALQDVILVLWLISLTEEQVIEQLTYPSKKVAFTAAYKFAEEQGIRYGTAKYLEGITTLTGIVGNIFTSFYGVSTTNGAKEPPRKNDIRVRGKSSLRTPQSKPAATKRTTSKTK